MKQVKYLNKAKIITKDNKKYILKSRKIDLENLYANLLNRGFNNYLIPERITESTEIYKYVDQLNISNSKKSQDIVYLASILHNKTTEFTELSLDEVKKIYEDTITKLDDTYNYYISLQDKIEEHIYMSPAELLLMNNISNIYLMLNFSRKNIEDYYKESENKNIQRKVLIHGNLSLDHIIETDDRYLISWNKARIDSPIYDLLYFYQNDYDQIEISSLYETYQSKYQFTKEEKYLFFSLINIPNIVKLNKNNLIDTINIRKLVNYLDKTIKFTLKENEKNQKTNNKEFK